MYVIGVYFTTVREFPLDIDARRRAIVVFGVMFRYCPQVIKTIELIDNLLSEQYFEHIFETQKTNRFTVLVDDHKQMVFCGNESVQGMRECLRLVHVVYPFLHGLFGGFTPGFKIN